MPAEKMHADELAIDLPLVRRLVASQFPEWVDLPLERVVSAGTDNAMYRLGDDMVVRLPRIESAARQVAKEQLWLPRLAPHLPLAIPTPVAKGEPSEDYPWPWSVYTWLEGEDAYGREPRDPRGAATELGAFVAALQRVDPAGGPGPGDHNAGRGVPLAARDGYVRAALGQLEDEVDTRATAAAWEDALRTPKWEGPPVWLHGDLAPGNLLFDDGGLKGVVDFGCLGVGDPACDVMAAWTFVGAAHRDAFRAATGVDDAAWARGRGWALSVALIALPYYRTTNPVFAASARRWIDDVLDDAERAI